MVCFLWERPRADIKRDVALSPLGAVGGKPIREHRIQARSQRSERWQFQASGTAEQRFLATLLQPWAVNASSADFTLAFCSAAIERAPPLDKVAIRVRLEGSSIFGFNRVTLEEVFDRVTGRGRQARCISIPVKLATRLHPLARIPANSRVPADLGAIGPFSPITAHRLHFTTHAFASERLTYRHQQQKDSKHGVTQCSLAALAKS